MGILKKFDRIEEAACAVTLVGMTIINFGNVLSRYLLHMSWSFTEEILMILFLWCTMFGTVVAFKRGEHLGLSIISDLAPDSIKVVFIVFSGLVSCLLMAFFLFTGIQMIHSEILYGQTTSVMNIPEPVSTISIPLCCILAIFRIIPKCYSDIKKIRGGNAS